MHVTVQSQSNDTELPTNISSTFRWITPIFALIMSLIRLLGCVLRVTKDQRFPAHHCNLCPRHSHLLLLLSLSQGLPIYCGDYLKRIPKFHWFLPILLAIMMLCILSLSFHVWYMFYELSASLMIFCNSHRWISHFRISTAGLSFLISTRYTSCCVITRNLLQLIYLSVSFQTLHYFNFSRGNIYRGTPSENSRIYHSD